MQSHQNTESCVLQYQAGKWGPDNRYNRKVLTPKEIDSKRRAITIAEPRLRLQNKTQVSFIEFHKQAKLKRLRENREIERLRKPSFVPAALPGNWPGLSNLNQVCVTRHKLSLDIERTVLNKAVWTKNAGSIKQINMFGAFDIFFVHAPVCVIN